MRSTPDWMFWMSDTGKKWEFTGIVLHSH